MTTRMSHPDREREEFEVLLLYVLRAGQQASFHERFDTSRLGSLFDCPGEHERAERAAIRPWSEWLAARGGIYIHDGTIYSTDGDDKFRISIPLMEPGS